MLDKQKDWIVHTEFWKGQEILLWILWGFFTSVLNDRHWRGSVGIESERDLAVKPGES
jgi:hypothetical protein